MYERKPGPNTGSCQSRMQLTFLGSMPTPNLLMTCPSTDSCACPTCVAEGLRRRLTPLRRVTMLMIWSLCSSHVADANMMLSM